MAPAEEDSVRVVQAGNTVTVADSVKIVVEGQKSPTKVNVSKNKTPSGKTSTYLGSRFLYKKKIYNFNIFIIKLNQFK